MGNGHKCLSLAFHFIEFYVFSCTLVEDVLMMYILVGNSSCMAPHHIPKADGRPSFRVQVHGRCVSEFVKHREGGMYLVKVDFRPLKRLDSTRIKGQISYISSIASCIGIGSSSPNPIISHEKFASRLRSKFEISCASDIMSEGNGIGC